MNNLKDIIQEKLIINKNIKTYHININIDEDNSFFTKDEINKITEFSKQLPIQPKYICDSVFIEPDSTHRPGQINLIFDSRKKTKKQGKHLHNLIRFRKDTDYNGYYIRFIMIDRDETEIFPNNDTKTFPKNIEWFNNIEECFKCINEQWDKLNLTSEFKKYE